ncbi:MAG: ADP-glyceromanno-heptose 6-epimerase [Proteobacteria bacterium]|nr:ADP-glyceromanno-heptose 6-epimerase [Alphaproteobacteria bacterium]NCC02497.1 ADP-glyceromanno-heptose 6-epimerase [Pseudomonadota bacterium]
MILITGGAGFIGSYLAAKLEERGERVIICDWLGTDDKWRNISKRDLEHIIAPEQMMSYLDEQAGNIKVIYHMGAISATTERDADAIAENNFRLSRKLWEWCKDNKTRLIYASSAATYGDGSAGFIDNESIEGLAKYTPLNAYGWSKHLFDRWIARQKDRGVAGPHQCVGLKFFNVYGPNEYHKGGMRSVAHQIYPVAVRKEIFRLFKSHHPDYEDGGQLRDFVWVGDCADVMLWLLDNPKVNGLFNMGTGQARSFADLGRAVYDAVGTRPMIQYRDMPEELRGKYQYFTQANMSKLRAAGYSKPFSSLEDGIKAYVQDFLAKDDPYI